MQSIKTDEPIVENPHIVESIKNPYIVENPFKTTYITIRKKSYYPCYIGNIINHCKNPCIKQPVYIMESVRGFIFSWLTWNILTSEKKTTECRQVKPDFLERFATPLVKVTGGES